MAAMDKTKERKNEMHVKDENANVSLESAVAALKEAQALLAANHDTDSPWQDPVVLLNKTAAALDEAALATRKDDAGKEESNKQKRAEETLMIAELSQQIIEERQAILGATQKVVAGTRPTVLWNPNTLIVYASHTGTSREYAHEFQSHLDSADVMNIKDVSLLDLQERKRAYFICSTFGLGRPPRDAEVVYTTLQILSTVDPEDGGELDDMLVAAPEREALLGLEIAVVALGNSKFEAFCKFGRDLSARLSALGAQEFLPLTILDAKNGNEVQSRQFREWERGALKFEGVSVPVPNEEAMIPAVQKGPSAKSKCCVIL